MTVMDAVRRILPKAKVKPKRAAVTSPPPLHRVPIRASYDGAGSSKEFENYWAAADALDADSSNSRGVRQTLVKRSRYEVANNGYADGMALTHADYLVGTGPQLRMQSSSDAFNELVEGQWQRWTKETQFRRKLWTQAHAKGQDGEGYGIARNNPKLRHPVKLDYVLIETEQCQTPYVPFGTVGYIDGIRFDEYGNPLWYDVLPYHPGGQWGFTQIGNRPEQIPAKFVMQWFQMRRPGQHRGVPETKSTLNCGAASRRWREATVSSAEIAALLSVLLKSEMPPNDGSDYQPTVPFSTLEMVRGMMTALPAGMEAQQMEARHPNAQYSEFHRAQINEQGRSRAMPVNVAMGDSSNHNFASGKLDHMPWHQRMKVEREDGNDLVLDPLFDLWYQELALTFGCASASTAKHTWDWPVLPVADERARASARNMSLSNGTTSLSAEYSADGKDFLGEELPKMAADYGLTVDEMKAVLRQKVFNMQAQGAV